MCRLRLVTFQSQVAPEQLGGGGGGLSSVHMGQLHLRGPERARATPGLHSSERPGAFPGCDPGLAAADGDTGTHRYPVFPWEPGRGRAGAIRRPEEQSLKIARAPRGSSPGLWLPSPPRGQVGDGPHPARASGSLSFP